MLSGMDCALLERLWHEQANVMRAFVLRRTGDAGEADEVVAEVYWRACRALAQGCPPIHNPTGWVWRILHHRRIDQARRRACAPRWVSWYAQSTVEESVTEGPDPVASEARAQVRQAICRLPARQAQMVVLRHYHGYSLEEIAHAWGISYGAAKAIHHRALTGLRRILGVRV
jgi:RNA polymerase sigma-70 factor (ECF subfamily)